MISAQKSIFSPRMDYNQWKPLGRGDPLKNDPTFDYVPPVLDQVHYWMEPESKSANNVSGGKKSEILILGVASKKPAKSPNYQPSAIDRKDTAYEPFQKFHQDKNSASYYTPNQRIARPNFFPSMTSQVIPLMSLAKQVLDRTLFSKVSESRMPYTVLMPPPMYTNSGDSSNSVTTPMTSRPPVTFPEPFTRNPGNKGVGVTVQESNLIYQSSSLGNQKEFEAVPSISWELPTSTETNKNTFGDSLTPPKSYMQIQFGPHNYSSNILEGSDSHHNVNYVTPPPLDESKMTFKGHVSDDNDISNSYVRIEKPQAQMDHHGFEINNIHPLPIIYPHAEPFRAPGNYYRPVSMQTIRDMETMKPPLATQSPIYARPTNPITNVLKKEQHLHPTSNYVASSSFIRSTFVTTPKPDMSSFVPTLPTTTNLPDMTTIPSPMSNNMVTTSEEMTTTQTLTTDPLFKHYKQPMEPLKGPLYLIIQGHSKVKTYKPAKQINGLMVQDSNEIPHKSVDYTIKHLHGYEDKEDLLQKADNIAKKRQARTGNLQTLKHVVQTGLGAINLESVKDEPKRRSDVGETELEAGYEVADHEGVTSEKYTKGIVEEALE